MATEQITIIPEVAWQTLFRVQSTALVKALGQKRGQRYLHAMARILNTEAGGPDAIPIRGPMSALANRESARGAILWMRSALPAILSEMRP